MDLPLKFVSFWYPKGVLFFFRTWKNTIAFLEEDLAVGLMFKLLFVPLFHDSSIAGRIISFFFRLFRIFWGLVAFFFVTIIYVLILVSWFGMPLWIVLASLYLKLALLYLAPLCIVGLLLFIHQTLVRSIVPIWHIKTTQDIWKSTKVVQADLDWQKLSQLPEVQSLLVNLELPNTFSSTISPVAFTTLTMQQQELVLAGVIQLAKDCEAKYITPAYFWISMLMTIPTLDQQLLPFNLLKNDFIGALHYLELKRRRQRSIYLWDEEYAVHHLQGVNRGWLGAPTPSLDSISVDLTHEVSTEGADDFIGREEIVSQVVHILSQEKSQDVLLVGEPGSGRSALIRYLAKLIINGDAPEALATKRLVELDITRLLANVTNEGDLATRIKQAFEEVKYVENIIIYVDELQNLGIGEAGQNYNLFSLLLPYIEGNYQFIASTDPGNYARIIEKNGSFARVFHRVDLPPASPEETVQIIEEQGAQLSQHSLEITFLAIKELVTLASKMVHDRVLPDSAIALLEEAKVSAVNGQLTSAIIKQVLQSRIDIPVVELDQNQKNLLLNLEGVIQQRLIGQEQAVKAVADTLRRSSTSLREENRPIGSFLFVGPTGVGKTELAKTLAETYFKSKDAFIRFDMSEYQNEHSLSQLIGSENNPGELTEAIKRKPYALVLLDEFEKASPSILNLFLQVLDDGRLTDFSGKTIDFTNTIIIATSNAASLTIAQGLSRGATVDQLNTVVREELLKVFKPELVNRFDGVVVFKPLTEQQLQQIVQIKLAVLQKQLKEQGYVVNFGPGVIQTLAQRGFDPVLGARPLRRLIQDTLEADLSKLILSGKLMKGQPLSIPSM